jgi:hypothetical protein
LVDGQVAAEAIVMCKLTDRAFGSVSKPQIAAPVSEPQMA